MPSEQSSAEKERWESRGVKYRSWCSCGWEYESKGWVSSEHAVKQNVQMEANNHISERHMFHDEKKIDHETDWEKLK